MYIIFIIKFMIVNMLCLFFKIFYVTIYFCEEVERTFALSKKKL